jgi:hypothetical protein
MWEEEAQRRVAADAPLLGTTRGREESDGLLRKEEDAHAGRERRSRARSRRSPRTPTLCTTTPCCPSSPSQPRLHRRPNVSATATFFTSPPAWSLLCDEPAALRCASI